MKNVAEPLISLIQSAGKAVMEVYQRAEFNTRFKEDHSPLTEADLRSNDIISEGLGKIFPGIPVISEESSYVEYGLRASAERVFIVDPLDGTKEFINRNGEFTINIGLAENGLLTAGVVYVPVDERCYFAVRGSGAYMQGRDGKRMELKTKSFFLGESGLGVVISRSHMTDETTQFLKRLNHPVTVSSGSSLKFLMIAEGSAHLYPRMGATMEWDTAAAQCILEEAGGSVIDIRDFQPLLYNKADLKNPSFLAFGALLDPESLSHIVLNSY